MTRPTLRERLRYRSDQFFQSGFTLQLFISALIVVAVITGFFIVAEIAGVHPGPDFGEMKPGDPGPYWPSVRLWWVIMHVMESYWLETSTFSQILSIFLTLFNFLVFAAIVGLVGSRIQLRLEQLRRGTSRVVEDGHIVILGWSGKVIPIFTELQAGLENRAKVFVLLTERPIDEIDARIRKSLRHRRAGLRWVIRQGSLTDMKDIELLAIERASEVIILRPDGADGHGDVQVVKTIMAAAHIITQGCGEASLRPDLIAEIESPSFVRLAHAAAKSLTLNIIHPSDHLSKIILQTARQHGLVGVYDELLSHLGNEVHFISAGQLAGKSWEDIVFSFRDAIPIGVFRGSRPHLAPAGSPDEFTVLHGDDIIAVARSQSAMHFETPRKPVLPPAPADAHPNDVSIRNVLLLGWNDKVTPLLREYAAYARSARLRFSVLLVSSALPSDLGASEISAIIGAGEELEIEVLKLDYFIPEALEKLEPGNFDAIIVLGELADGSQVSDPDTRVILTLLLLRSLRDRAVQSGTPFPPQQQIVGEILDSGNKDLAAATGTLRDVIISNDLVSKMIAQVCRDRRTGAVMDELFDEEGKEIYLRQATLYAAEGSTASFDQLILAAVRRGEAAIGYYDDAEKSVGNRVTLNPPKDAEIRIDASLRLIVIAEGERV